MASLRPEGALNSARGLVEIGRIDDALEALHDVLGNRRFRQWNSNMEKIAEEYVKLCLTLGKPRYAKDGLIQFRNICQPNNLQSVDGILKMFRSAAEEKVRETRGKLVVGADGLVDLEEVESGENLLVSALSPEASVVDERAARAALRDLWDTLRVILEVCRNQPALDETYHATAVKAFDFCRYVFHSVSVSYRVRAFYLDDDLYLLLRFNRSAQSNLLDHMITGVETSLCLLHFVPMLNIVSLSYPFPNTLHISLSSEFKRKNEFRRICETLRLHQQQSYTRSTSHAAAAIAAAVGGTQSAVAQVDPVVRTVETRNYQLKVAIELGLWSVAFQTVDEIYSLLSKKRPTPNQMITYYSNLAKILWMSSSSQQHQVFHAACLLKFFAISSNISSQETVLGQIADSAILAVLCTSVPDALAAIAGPMETTTTDADGTQTVVDITAEKTARLTILTGCGGVPTTQSLMSDIIARDLLSVCSEPVGKIHAALVSGSKDVAETASLISGLNGELAKYVPGLRRVALVKAIKEMQSMYSCLKFEKFETMTAAIMPLTESVRLLGQLKRTDQIDVSVDYHSKTISFGSSPSASSGLGMIDCAVESLRMAAARVRAAARSAKVAELAQELLFDDDAFAARLEKERRKCIDRRLATDARKDAIEQDTIRRANELAEQLQRAEEERLEADAKARAAEQSRREYEAKKREDMLFKAKALVERMVQLGGPIAQEVSAMSDDQLAALGLAKLEAMQKDQFAKERQDRITKRRNESKRIEYTARLVRLAENEKITEWSRTVYEQDKEFFAKIAAEKADEWRSAAEAKKASIDALLPFSDLLSEWKNNRMDEFAHKLALKAEERRQKILAKQASDAAGSSPRASESGSNVAPTSTISRDEFKEMAKSLPTWRADASATSSRAAEE